MEKFRLTTEDNPYNPFTEWDQWYFYDLSKGYYTCERLARLVSNSKILPDSIDDGEMDEAADQLLFEGAFNKQGLYVKYKKIDNPNTK